MTKRKSPAGGGLRCGGAGVGMEIAAKEKARRGQGGRGRVCARVWEGLVQGEAAAGRPGEAGAGGLRPPKPSGGRFGLRPALSPIALPFPKPSPTPCTLNPFCPKPSPFSPCRAPPPAFFHPPEKPPLFTKHLQVWQPLDAFYIGTGYYRIKLCQIRRKSPHAGGFFR